MFFFVKKGVKMLLVIKFVKWLIGLVEGLKKVNSSNRSIIIEKMVIFFGFEEWYWLYNKNNCVFNSLKILFDVFVWIYLSGIII